MMIRSITVKNKIMFLSGCLILILATDASAITPIVELLFDDATNVQTENMGSIGGTQNLMATGLKELTPSPHLPEFVSTFDSGKQWRAYAYSEDSAYSEYSLPELAELTVAFWVHRLQQNNGADFASSNMFTISDDTGIKFGAFWHFPEDPCDPSYRPEAFPVQLIGPQGPTIVQSVDGVLPPDTWTHIAITYDSSEGTLYIDGQSVASIGISPDWDGSIPSGCKVSISDTTDMLQLINGMDNFFIFDSVLSQGQVQTLMATNRVPTIATTCAEVDGYFLSDGDVNEDCYVDIIDVAVMMSDWLKCVDPGDPLCGEPWL